MVKNTPLSADIDLIKEFEELRIKQKLLIETLNKKNKSQENDLLQELNSKLEFLVKIFKEASKDDTEVEHMDEKFTTISNKLGELSELITSNFDSINERISKLEKMNSDKLKSESLKNSNDSLTQESTSSSESETAKQDVSNSNLKENPQSSNSSDIPPPPTFKVDVKGQDSQTISAQKDSNSQDTQKKEKRKWF